MFCPSLSWLLLLANFMSLAELVSVGLSTSSYPPGEVPGLMSAATANSAALGMLLVHHVLSSAGSTSSFGYAFWMLYERFFLMSVKLERSTGAFAPPP